MDNECDICKKNIKEKIFVKYNNEVKQICKHHPHPEEIEIKEGE